MNNRHRIGGTDEMANRRATVPHQITSAMGSAAEAWVRVQLQLRCLQHPGWEVVVGGFGHDLALINVATKERRTIEIKSRQAISGLTKHNGRDTFRQDLYGEQTRADFIVFVWFDRGLLFVKRVNEMKLGFVKGVPRRKFSFAARGDPHENAWGQLFSVGLPDIKPEDEPESGCFVTRRTEETRQA